MKTSTNRVSRNLAAATCLTVCSAAGAAVDVCNPALPYTMPDHDQVRAPIFAIPGLQGNGTQYCVPTCTTDLLTYLQNHGYPALAMGPGPGPWVGTQAIYNAFTNDIESLASLMSTDPAGGTNGSNAFAGVNQWIANSGYTGDIVVSMFGMSGNSAPELGDIAFSLIARCPISVSVGWYENMGNSNYVRRGGHCVAVTRIPDFCSPFPKISIRDPGTSVGSDQFSQAAGTTETYNVTPSLFIVRRDADDNSVIYSGPAVRIAGYGSANRTAIIDGYRAFFPAWGLAACNNPVNGSCITQHLPNPTITGLPQHNPFRFPANTAVLDLDISADSLTSWTLVRSTDSSDYALWRQNFGTAPSRQVFPALDAYRPRSMCSGREPRALYFLDSNPHVLVKLNTATGTVTPATMSEPASAICFDDKRNEIVVLSSAARRIVRFDGDTLIPASSRTLPSNVVIGGEPRMSVCPVGSYVWLTSGETTGYGLVNGGPDTMVVAGTISAQSPLRGVDTTDVGTVVTTSGGQVVEFSAPAAGQMSWDNTTHTKWSSLADGPIFRIARSRTNYTRELHSSPEETVNVLPTIVAPAVPDCPADFNVSGGVSVQDLFDFLAAYFAGDVAADINESGTLTVQDIFDYLAAYFRGC